MDFQKILESIGERNYHRYFGGTLSDDCWIRTRLNTLATWEAKATFYYRVNILKDG